MSSTLPRPSIRNKSILAFAPAEANNHTQERISLRSNNENEGWVAVSHDKHALTVVSMYSFAGELEGDLSFSFGQEIQVTMRDAEWYFGSYELPNGETVCGVFPQNYVKSKQ